MARCLRALALGVALTTLVAHAQTLNPADQSQMSVTQYRIDAWQTEQGLPQNTVQAVYQTRDGHLWVGTGGGLARFDGTRFITFENANTPELAMRPIFGFMEDRDGWLWIGHSRGATRYKDGVFERVITDQVMEGRRVWAFAQDAAGVVWAAGENGLVRWEQGKVTRFGEAEGLPTRRLRSVALDRDGTLWIGTTGGGLVSYAGGKFTAHDPAHGFPHNEVRHVLADPEGGVWAATAGAGLVHVGAKGDLRIYGVKDGLPTDQLTYLALDKSGALWVGTWGAGVSRFAGGRFSAISSGGGLGGDQIWSLHADREGSIWAGTWHGGLNRLSPRPFAVFGKPEGLAGDNVRSVLQARDGSMWVGSAGGGVNRIEKGRITATYTRKEGLPTEEVSGLYEDKDGAIWVATYTGGVARLRNGRVEVFGTRDGLQNVDVRVMYRDTEGTLWAGTVNGLARFDGRRFHPVADEGAPTEGVTTMLQDRSGTLWFGTAGSGLVRFRDGRFATFTRKDGLSSNWIMALYEDASGSMWIGTNGEGVCRLREGHPKCIRTTDGLWDGLAQTVLEDRQGNLWFTSNRGFFSAPRAELDAFADGNLSRVSSVGYGPGDALRVTTFAGNVQPAGAVDREGLLWLPSLKGLVIVNPAHLPGMGEPPPVAVEDVMVNGEHERHDQVVLKDGSGVLSVRYFAGTLLDADRVRFRYQLEGSSPQWVDAGRNREAVFPALSHGVYRFRVAASVDGRRWREAAQPVDITVEPRFYQTVWFVALMLLSAFAAGMGLFQLRNYRLRRRAEQMERLVAQRTEELRVANEHLSRLSFADPLTGLGNRRRLDEVLDAEWRRAARSKTPLAVVLVDIDAFKAYNDSLGHIEGDKCLVAVSEVIRDITMRAGDFAGRYGGEEFVIVIPGADQAAAMKFAEELRAAVEARMIPHPASPASKAVTVSLGVASQVPSGDATPLGLIAAADRALYRAKEEGRNRVG